jgi:hypothetical protein
VAATASKYCPFLRLAGKEEIATKSVENAMKKPMSEEIIRPKDFYDLFARLKMPVAEQDWWLLRWSIIAAFTLLAVVCLYIALIFDRITLFQLLLSAVSVPLWIGAYFFFPFAITAVFNRLWHIGVIGDYRGDASHEITYQELVRKLARQIHAPWLLIVGAAIFIGFWINRWSTYSTTEGLSMAFLRENFRWLYLVVFSLTTLYALMAFIAFLCVVRLLFVAIAINRLFGSFTIHVFPLYPDGSGGLGILHQLLWMSNIMLLAGLCFTVSLTSQATDSIFFSVLLFGYLILFPATLTIWLVLPHKAMIQTRNAHLQVIVDEYNKTLQESENTLTQPASTLSANTDRLVTLLKHYDQVKSSFPTWPVEISFTRRLGVTLVLPLLTSLIPAIINLITKIIK